MRVSYKALYRAEQVRADEIQRKLEWWRANIQPALNDTGQDVIAAHMKSHQPVIHVTPIDMAILKVHMGLEREGFLDIRLKGVPVVEWETQTLHSST